VDCFIAKFTDMISSFRAATMQQIEFTFRAPEAQKVYIAGTFNDWNAKSVPMKKVKDDRLFYFLNRL
jgi:1,4-alpha-glucan branching enzyme